MSFLKNAPQIHSAFALEEFPFQYFLRVSFFIINPASYRNASEYARKNKTRTEGTSRIKHLEKRVHAGKAESKTVMANYRNYCRKEKNKNSRLAFLSVFSH